MGVKLFGGGFIRRQIAVDKVPADFPPTIRREALTDIQAADGAFSRLCSDRQSDPNHRVRSTDKHTLSTLIDTHGILLHDEFSERADLVSWLEDQ